MQPNQQQKQRRKRLIALVAIGFFVVLLIIITQIATKKPASKTSGSKSKPSTSQKTTQSTTSDSGSSNQAAAPTPKTATSFVTKTEINQKVDNVAGLHQTFSSGSEQPSDEGTIDSHVAYLGDNDDALVGIETHIATNSHGLDSNAGTLQEFISTDDPDNSPIEFISNLGDNAYFNTDTNELLVQQGNYLFIITVEHGLNNNMQGNDPIQNSADAIALAKTALAKIK